ncbi:MAG TPA: 6-bladed beta-propeller [Bacteroidales bacterium]|nr:6-bladed beta-propeller [Bacteroidales bacterium]
MSDKMKISGITLIILPILFSCNNIDIEQKPGKIETFPVKIDFNEAILNNKIISLSDIADSIKYIRLEDVKNHPLNEIYYSFVFDNDIFLYAGPGSGLLRFNTDGHFLNEVGKLGNGPHDYYPGSEFAVLSDPQRVFILTRFKPRKILELDYNGYFIDKFLINDLNDGGFEALSIEKFLFLSGRSDTLNNEIPEHLACITDKYGKVLSSVRHPLADCSDNVTGYVHGGAISGRFFNGSPLFFDEYAIDTIYSVNENRIYPRYILNKGVEGIPLQINFSVSRRPLRYKYIYTLPASFSETPANLHFMFISKGRSYLATYNKKSGDISSMSVAFDTLKQVTNDPPRFINDIDGGLSVVPGKSNREGDIWYYLIPEKQFKNRLSAETGKLSGNINQDLQI